jgi:5-methylcytosine-specific restriction endonuclease McrA
MTENKYKKTKISKILRKQVWENRIGLIYGKVYCPVCNITLITQFDFECGHAIAEAKGGETTVDNLWPICESCNKSMNTVQMDVKNFKYNICESDDVVFRRQVWDYRIGLTHGKAYCPICKLSTITQIDFASGYAIPKQNGGTTSVDNLWPICENCNASKTTKINKKKMKYKIWKPDSFCCSIQ